MLLAELVAVSDRIRAHDVRQDKVKELAGVFEGQSATDAASIVELLLCSNLFEPVSSSSPDRPLPPASDRPILTCDQVVDVIGEIDQLPAEVFLRTLLAELMERATGPEQLWLLEITTHRRLDRATFDLVLSAAANAARVPVQLLRRGATLAGSLPLAVRIALERSADGLAAITCEPGRPVPPTGIDRIERIEEVVELSRTSIVEWDIGTDRIQVHRFRGAVTVYDEHLTDVTAMAPVVVDQAERLPRGDLVLDGWTVLEGVQSDESPVVDAWTKHSPSTRRGREATFCDILFDGVPVVDDPLEHRRGLLEAVVPSAWTVPTLDVGDLSALALAMNDCVRRGYRGLIVKPLSSIYEGELVKPSWVSVPASHLVLLAVIGANRGSGKRSHLLSTVHLAAELDDGALVEVGKTARGLDHETIVRQTQTFARLMLPGEEGDTGAFFRLQPEVVAFTSVEHIQTSATEEHGFELDGLRIVGYQQRSDVDDDVISVQELRRLATTPPPSLPPVEPVSTPGLPTDPTVPRLPPSDESRAASSRPASAKPTVQTPTVSGALGVAAAAPPTANTVHGVEFEPYEEPGIDEAERTWKAVIASRVLALGWVLALLLIAITVRSSSGTADIATLTTVGGVGIVVMFALTLTGWIWTDRLVQTLQLLDGRRPGRLRCATAWMIVSVTVLVLTVTIVPLEPTQPADIRPVILAAAFSIAVWRPYSLVRRILATLTRERSDTLIASGYIADLLGFGVLWWRLAELSSSDDATTRDLDTLVGALGALTIAMVVGLVVWMGLISATRRAVEFRRLSQRTRYEHRMLRLGGLDPTDPNIWWALVQRRADEERASSTSDGAPPAELLTVDHMIEVTRREHSVAFRQLDDTEAERLVERLHTEFSAIIDGTADVDGPAEVDGTTDDISELEGLLSRAGALEVEAALNEHRRGREDSAAPRLGPPRLLAIESTRLLTATALASVTAVALWLVVLSVDTTSASDSRSLPTSAVADLDLARRIFWGLFTSGCALSCVWAHAVLMTARRAGMTGASLGQVRFFAGLATTACIAGFVLDGDTRGGTTLVLTVVIVWCAVSVGFNVEQVRTWLAIPTAALVTWIATLPTILFVAWLGGLASPIEASQSVRRLAFTTILLALGCARAAAVSALTSIEIEDELRVAPELAVPVHRTPRPAASSQ